jgi:hypothetical protein
MKLTIVLTFLLTFAMCAAASSKKIAKDLEKVNPETVVEVVIQYNQEPTAAHHQKVIDQGGKLKETLNIIKSAVYTIQRKALDRIAEDPDVVYISPNRGVKPQV